MSKTILITGSTDGIGKLAAEALVKAGHKVILHGRNLDKLNHVRTEMSALGDVSAICADLSDMKAVQDMAADIVAAGQNIDVLVNNAGVFVVSDTDTPTGHDVRIMVNTLAPVILTQAVLPLIPLSGRVVNLSSAAQRSVHKNAITGNMSFSNDMEAYAQSKLALTLWTMKMSQVHPEGPVFVALNPGSLLATNMVRAMGIDGNDVTIGRDVILKCALSPEIEGRSGQYYDTDAGGFGPAHADTADPDIIDTVSDWIGSELSRHKKH